MSTETKWDLSIPGQAILSWYNEFFNNVSIIVWRDIVIKAETTVQNRKTHGGIITKLDLYIEDEITEHLKQFDDEVFGEIHIISNGYYYLAFRLSGRSLVLIEKLVHEEFEKNATESQFQIISIESEDKIRAPYQPPTPDRLRIELFSHVGNDVTLNSHAYFEDNDLIVDYWELGRRTYYEDEYFITIQQADLPILFEEFKIVKQDKKELLNAIAALYNNRDCFTNFKALLNEKSIPHVNKTIHH